MKKQFKIGDRVKIPKTKSTGTNINDYLIQNAFKEEKHDYLIVIQETKINNFEQHVTCLFPTTDLWIRFLNTDLEHYEEFVLPKCWFVLYNTKEEFNIINGFYNKGWTYCSYENRCGYHNNGDNQIHTNNWVKHSKESKEELLEKDYIQITFEQFQKHILKHILKQETMKKEIIGYKLIKPEYRQAAEAVVSQYDPYYDFKNWDLNLEKDGDMFTKDSNQSKWLKEAGVLDLWFEPIYKEEKQIIQMYSSNKGMFEIEVVDGKAYYRPENKELDKFYIKNIIARFSKIESTFPIYPYSTEVTKVNVGCMHDTRKEDWEKVYKLLK